MCPNTTAGLYTIIGTIIGGLIGYFSAVRLVAITTRRQAGIRLRAAFAPAIAKLPLSKGNVNAIDQMLRDELTPQAIAIEEFRHFITNSKKEAYQKAWENYHRPVGAGGGVFFLEYTNEELFKQRIHAILQFTE